MYALLRDHIDTNLEALKNPWSDEVLAVWLPIVAYWVYSIFWQVVMMAEWPFFEQYRIHTMGDMEKRNKVSLSRVLAMVVVQHIIQGVLGFLVLKPVDPMEYALAQEKQLNVWTGFFLSIFNRFELSFQLAQITQWVIVPLFQFFLAM